MNLNEKNKVWIDAAEITLAGGGAWEIYYEEVFLENIEREFLFSIDKNLLSLENPEEGIKLFLFRTE